MQLGFYNHVNTKPKATRGCLESVRKIYPDNPIVISCDNGFDFTDMCKELNVLYHHNTTTIGYSTTEWGWNKNQIIEWLDRMYRGVTLLNTEFFMMLEDDIILMKPVTLQPEWECVGQMRLYEGQVPQMPPEFLNIIHTFSGVKPIHDYYTTGGGSIFKTKTFVENYFHVRHFIKTNFDFIQQHIYKTIGWMDCMMCVFYMLCGKTLVQNDKLYNNFPVVMPFDIASLPDNIEILHNYKDHY
jgi:hypothetical protein